MLGAPFLNDYYQVYDLTRNQIGLVPSIYATSFTPQDRFGGMYDKIVLLSMLVFGLFLTSIMRFSHTYCCGNKYDKNANDYVPEEERQLLEGDGDQAGI